MPCTESFTSVIIRFIANALLEKLEQATKNDLPENQISSLTQEVIDKTILLLKELGGAR